MKRNLLSFRLINISILLVLIMSLTICSRQPPIQAILILLDAARPDRFSCYGYDKNTTPEIDSLANNGIVFSNCFSQGTHTRAALPCLLYSRYFVPNIFPHNPSIPLFHPEELFENVDNECISIPKVLEQKGFLTAAISSHIWIHSRTQFAQEFQEFFFLPSILTFDEKYHYPRANQVIDFSLDWISRNKNKNFFLYIHIMDTHFPHFFEEDAKYYFEQDDYNAANFLIGGFPKNSTGVFSEIDLKYLNALYDGSLHYTDRQIGRLVKFLQNEGKIEDTLLIITSDHGEFLLDNNNRFSHGGFWYDKVAKIPLVIHYPKKLKPKQEPALCEMVDIGPTLLDLLNVETPLGKQTDGINMISVIEGKIPAKEKVYCEGGIRTSKWKCLFESSSSRVLSEKSPFIGDIKGELYNMITDPEETENLFLRNPDGIVERLLEQYRSRMFPLYARFKSTHLCEQPNFPFAISSNSFKFNLKIPQVSYLLREPKMLLQKETINGWLQIKHRDYYWIFAKPSADTLTVEFFVPNGQYYLLVDMNGACYMEVSGEQKLIRAKPFRYQLNWPINPVEFGIIEIDNNLFSARIDLRSKIPWFAIRSFGFEPVIEGQKKSQEQKKRLERLKALGYIK